MIALFQARQRPISEWDVFLWAIVHDDITDCEIHFPIRLRSYTYGLPGTPKGLTLSVNLSAPYATCSDELIKRFGKATGRDVEYLIYPF